MIERREKFCHRNYVVGTGKRSKRRLRGVVERVGEGDGLS